MFTAAFAFKNYGKLAILLEESIRITDKLTFERYFCEKL